MFKNTSVGFSFLPLSVIHRDLTRSFPSSRCFGIDTRLLLVMTGWRGKGKQKSSFINTTDMSESAASVSTGENCVHFSLSIP